ncbi:hypothetical protein CPT_Penshu1_037 [Escherichia phage Penshu1]|uniref:Uncharacterized protein n=1 Tax=Escherichia phage Penshu1 TaxID=2591101 RepID=A0A5B9N6W3_9CAUD|nr:hypothetical protein CPT_Penshu1_037 [Escherichia phage Penshu1]
MKICVGCHTEKDLRSFTPNGRTCKGTQKYEACFVRGATMP